MTNTTNQPRSVEPLHTTPNAWTGARLVNLVLGIWLFISAFILRHTTASKTNTWILGVLIAVAAAVATNVPQIRWVNTVLAIWLFFSTLWIPHVSSGAVWNNLIVAVVVFIVSMISSRGRATVR